MRSTTTDSSGRTSPVSTSLRNPASPAEPVWLTPFGDALCASSFASLTSRSLTTIGVPLVADRFGARRPQLLIAAAIGTVALSGIILVPDPAFLWVAILGLALGTVFPLALTLPIDVADDPARVGSVAALMLLGGYVLSSVGPVLLGAARDVTGDFTASLWLLVGVGVLLVASCALLSPERLREGIGRT